MAVSEGEVERIAILARLRLGVGDARQLAVDLSSILEHMEALREADVSGTLAVGDMTEWPAPFRNAEAEPDSLASRPGSIAPEWRDGFFVVPRLPGVESEDGGSSA